MGDNMNKQLLALTIIVLLLILLSSVVMAQGPTPKFVYYENENGDLVRANYNEAIQSALDGDYKLYEAIKAAIIEARLNDRPIFVEDMDGNVVVYSDALDEGKTYLEAHDDPEFQAGPQSPVKQLIIDPDTGDPVEVPIQAQAAGTARATAGASRIIYDLTTGLFDPLAGESTANWTIAGSDGSELGLITEAFISEGNTRATVYVTNMITDTSKNYTIVPKQDAMGEGYLAPAVVTVELLPAKVDSVTIQPDTDQTIMAGVDLIFTAEARDQFDNLITDETTDFTWGNATAGVFNEEEAGNYNVTATYDGKTSAATKVTVNLVHNITQDKYYNTIQAAIDEAVDDDEIVVAAGEYEEDLEINVKGITIKAASNPDSTIKGLITITAEGTNLDGFKMREYQVAGGGDPVIDIDAEGVTVQNMDLYMEQFISVQPHEIVVRPASHGAQILNNVVDRGFLGGHSSISVRQGANNVLIEGNKVAENGASAIAAGVGDGCTVIFKNNTVYNGYDEGIWFWPVHVNGIIVVEGNTVVNYSVGNPDKQALKVVSKPAIINGETETLGMYNAILDDNPGIDSVELSWMKDVHNVTQDTFYDTIQDAITAADEHDTIGLTGEFDGFHVNKSLTIKGGTINVNSGNVPGSIPKGIYISGADLTVVIDGVTIQDGQSLNHAQQKGIITETGSNVDLTVMNSNISQVVTGIYLNPTNDLPDKVTRLSATNNTIFATAAGIGTDNADLTGDVVGNTFDPTKEGIGLNQPVKADGTVMDSAEAEALKGALEAANVDCVVNLYGY